MRTRLLPAFGFVVVGLLGVAACTPASTYNKGIEMSYHPSGKADAQQKLVNSAIELKQDSDQQTVKDAGGIYLGELEVLAARSQDFASGAGATGLSGRVSLECATRGATHFYMASSSVEHSVQQAQGPHLSIGGNGSEQVNKTKVRYVLYRVEQDGWAKLPKNYQPEGIKGSEAPPTAKASGPGGS